MLSWRLHDQMALAFAKIMCTVFKCQRKMFYYSTVNCLSSVNKWLWANRFALNCLSSKWISQVDAYGAKQDKFCSVPSPTSILAPNLENHFCTLNEYSQGFIQILQKIDSAGLLRWNGRWPKMANWQQILYIGTISCNSFEIPESAKFTKWLFLSTGEFVCVNEGQRRLFNVKVIIISSCLLLSHLKSAKYSMSLGALMFATWLCPSAIL